MKSVINYIRAEYNIGKIIIWGRSMGAVSAILYGRNDVNCYIFDSPYSDLYSLILEIGINKTGLPKFIIESVIQFVIPKIKEALKGKDIF